ncbi:DUF1992 domain-containing protein [Rhodococcus kyotonensis]|uniref:Molecular chaperone DnaJ n=1 Tax=Rhodococcoides kyotonense TaxID=398843 RepID=A0A177Y6Y6_9NOCA|nr:DUF1992 domain-containing protein [Rhodococcus kyotonensis]NIL77760.1 hypothetical protein [Rhodococcus sp. B10]OAK51255.1 molecular chaperone DnaJ [Rhodococcus kyotonensis]
MTERKKHGVTFESFVDKQIREAQEQGAFENLEGAGKPIPKGTGPHDELWWIKGYLKRENLSTDALLPESLQLRKEIEKLPAVLIDMRLEESVRSHLHDLNARVVAWIRVPSPPLIPISPVDVDAWVEQWRVNRAAVDAAARASRASSPGSSAAPTTRPGWWQRLRARCAR